jgi:carboxyl-terminal processing protease
MAGALRDQKDAELIGKQTFGKGSVQDLKNYTDWGSLRITSGHWLTPDKTQINGKGIKPDIKVEMEPSMVGSDSDKQLDRAIKYINSNY